MRLRTGHGPNDWSDNIPGCHASVNGHGGTLVQGEDAASKSERSRRERRKKGIGPKRRPPVDLNDYAREHRLDDRPRCGRMMPQAGEPCARLVDHRGDCKTAFAMEYQRLRRRAVA